MKMKYYLLALMISFSLSSICNGAAAKGKSEQKVNETTIKLFLINVHEYLNKFSDESLDLALVNLKELIKTLEESCSFIEATILKREAYRAAFKAESKPDIKIGLLNAIHKCNMKLLPFLVQFKNESI